MTTVLIFLAVLSVLVLAHECGHFFLAKLFGIRVEEFGFGFPPRLFGATRGGTLYSVNAIPLGGFVRLAGEQGEVSGPHTFAAKPVWQRLVVLAGGVGMNVILAWVLFSVGSMVGVPRALEGLPPDAIVREQSVMVVEVLPGSPAAQSGLVPGDSVVSLDGQAVASVGAVQQAMRSGGERDVTLEVKQGQKSRSVVVRPHLLAETGLPGIGVALMETGIVSFPWYTAPLRGAETTWLSLRAIVSALYGLVYQLVTGGGVSPDVSGPVGIAVATGRVARLGFVYILQFTALLSLNLAIINFLPFPALDGGRAVFALIEKIRRKPVGSRIEGLVHQAGFFILMGLVLIVTVADVRRFGSAILAGLTGWGH